MKKPSVDDLPEIQLEDAAAIQACVRGEALPHQQKHAIDFIINTLSDAYAKPFAYPNNADAYFMSGRRWVGWALVKYTTINLQKLKGPKDA